MQWPIDIPSVEEEDDETEEDSLEEDEEGEDIDRESKESKDSGGESTGIFCTFTCMKCTI